MCKIVTLHFKFYSAIFRVIILNSHLAKKLKGYLFIDIRATPATTLFIRQLPRHDFLAIFQK